MKMIDSKLDVCLISYLIKLISKAILNYPYILETKHDCHSEMYNWNSMEMKVSTNKKFIDMINKMRENNLFIVCFSLLCALEDRIEHRIHYC